MKPKSSCKWGRLVQVALCIVVGLATAWNSQAAERYPAKPITVMNGFNPGGMDVLMRPFLEKFQEVLKQPIKNEYKPGAGGAVAAVYVANAKPDGYLTLVVSPGLILLNPLTMDNVGYTMDDFVSICRVVGVPVMIYTKSDAPWRTFKDLIEDAKKRPGQLNFSTTMRYGAEHFPMEMVQRAAGFKINLIPAGSAAQTVTTMLGGHVDFAASMLPPAAPHIKSGALRGLALMAQKRHPEFPDVPTLPELGLPLPVEGWVGWVAPKGVSKEVLNTLTETADRTISLHGKEIEAQLLKMEAQLAYLNGQDYDRQLRQQRDICRPIAEEFKKSGQK